MQQARSIAREFAAALAVLAVFALTFVYQPFMPSLTHQTEAQSLQALITDASICGKTLPGDHQSDHGGCHACRADASLLPLPPCDPTPAFFVCTGVTFATVGSGVALSAAGHAYRSRAPPASA